MFINLLYILKIPIFPAAGTQHLKPRNLVVNERLSNVVLTWDKPLCSGDINSYIFVLLGGKTSYDKAIKVGITGV